MPKVTINGKEVEVEAGTTIMAAADQVGIRIPRYCYHPDLSIAGNCRICLVEVEGMPKLVTSCSTVVSDGMVVRTDTPVVKKAVTAVLEFLLLDHPIDCPICDQAGECWLQNYYMEVGLHTSRMPLSRKVHKAKAIKLGKMIVLDKERCILCSRCIRFCYEVTGTRELGFFNRGNKTEIGSFNDEPVDNPYSGNLADVCPVGALTSRDFRFARGVWLLQGVPSVCPACSTGCNIQVDFSDRTVYRFIPRRNPEVNKSWLCDEGRLSYKSLNRSDRVTEPMIRKSGRLEPVSWGEAIKHAVGLLRPALKKSSGKKAGCVATAWATNEELYLFGKLLEKLGSTAIDFRTNGAADPTEMGDSLLRRKDKSPNTTGALELGLLPGEGGTSLISVLRAAREGSIKILYLLGPGIAEGEGGGELSREALAKTETIILHTPWKCQEMKHASVVFPAATFIEKEGTFTNSQRRVQRVTRAFDPPGDARDELSVLLAVLKELGEKVRASDPAGVMDLIASEKRSFKGLKSSDIPPTGALLGREV
jgi:NADH-quinone oxidoreductase subunit G